MGTFCRLGTPLFMNDGTLFAFVFHKMQQDKTSHDKTFLHKVSQQQYIAQTKSSISEMYRKINGNILRVLCLSLDVTTTKTLFSCGCLRRYGNKVTLDLQTTVLLITRKSSLNSRCQFSIAVCKALVSKGYVFLSSFWSLAL